MAEPWLAADPSCMRRAQGDGIMAWCLSSCLCQAPQSPSCGRTWERESHSLAPAASTAHLENTDLQTIALHTSTSHRHLISFVVPEDL